MMADTPEAVAPPTRSLRTAAHPQARMQELLSRESPPPPETPEPPAILDADPESHTEEYTEKITPSHTESMAKKNTDTHAETLPSVQKRRRKRIQMEGDASSLPSAKASANASTSAPGRTSISQRISDELQREPVVRKTIDIPASLNERLQEYCAAHRIKTERRVFLVLLETFLEEEGF